MTNSETLKMLFEEIKKRFSDIEPQEQADFLEKLAEIYTIKLNNMNPRIKPIKSALSEKYGYKNVSVVNGKGTAWGWVEAHIYVPKSNPCDCRVNDPYCATCRATLNEVNKEAKSISYEALKTAGLKFGTYSSDMGDGSMNDEFILQVSFNQ